MLTSIGVEIGLVVAVCFTRVLRALIFGVRPLDPMTFTIMPVVLAATAVLASYLSTGRAARVDPVETLRVG